MEGFPDSSRVEWSAQTDGREFRSEFLKMSSMVTQIRKMGVDTQELSVTIRALLGHIPSDVLLGRPSVSSTNITTIF